MSLYRGGGRRPAYVPRDARYAEWPAAHRPRRRWWHVAGLIVAGVVLAAALLSAGFLVRIALT